MADTNIKKNQTAEIPTKSGSKYSYQYVDIAQIHDYLEQNDMKYYQFIKRIDNDDYIFTKRYIDGKWEEEALQGCKVVDATLYGNDNPAQKQGSAITYARRYSLLMAFGLATEDDDANSLEKGKSQGNNKSLDNWNEKVTDAQARTVYAVMTKKGLDVVALLKKNYNISNTKDLTKAQYAAILKKINNLPDKKDEGYTFTGMTDKTDTPYEENSNGQK